MPATVSAQDLIALVNRAGFCLTEAADKSSARIYIWSDADNSVLYIGKADGQSPAARHAHESRWAPEDPHNQNSLLSGIVYLIARNDAHVQYYNITVNYDGTVVSDLEQMSELLTRNDWALDANYGRSLISAARKGWSVPDVENLLIRLCVRLGVPIANASGAGLWESSCGTPTDLIAALLSDDIVACKQGPGPTAITPTASRHETELLEASREISRDES